MTTASFPDPGFRLANSECLVLDSEKAIELAKQYASLPQCPSERELKETHVAFLAERFRNGLMLAFNWSDVDCEGVTYRVNGQHSSNALLQVAQSINGNTVTFHLDHYKAQSEKGVALLHTLFDASKQTRSKLDISHSWQGTNKKLHGNDPKTCKIMMDGVLWFRKNVEKAPVPKGRYASSGPLPGRNGP